MPDFLLEGRFAACTPVLLNGCWWLPSSDVAHVLGISLDSVSVRSSSGASLHAVRSCRWHGLRLWDAFDVHALSMCHA